MTPHAAMQLNFGGSYDKKDQLVRAVPSLGETGGGNSKDAWDSMIVSCNSVVRSRSG